MKKLNQKNQNPLKEPNVPWITKDGYFDLTKYPIDSILKQSIGSSEEKFYSACNILGAMASAGRKEAGIFLFGLLVHSGDDLEKKESVVKALRGVQTPQAAKLFFNELDRIESSNTTRGYINTILRVLGDFPSDLVEDGFERLILNPKWSYKMKNKFKAALEYIRYKQTEDYLD